LNQTDGKFLFLLLQNPLRSNAMGVKTFRTLANEPYFDQVVSEIKPDLGKKPMITDANHFSDIG
jgi:hypothetical protein